MLWMRISPGGTRRGDPHTGEGDADEDPHGLGRQCEVPGAGRPLKVSLGVQKSSSSDNVIIKAQELQILIPHIETSWTILIVLVVYNVLISNAA